MECYTKNTKQLIYTIIILTGVLFIGNFHSAKAQGDPEIIKMSGIVVDGDSAFGVPGVHIYIKTARVGTISNKLGLFSLPTMAGDTVVFSAVGYKNQQLVVPPKNDKGFTVLIDLKTDTTFLPIVEVFPYPTEELFKEAFLALELPKDERRENMERNLNQQALNRMAAAMPMDGSSNHRYFMDQQIYQRSNRFFSPSLSLLNPFAWSEFIKSVKRGDLKKKE